MIIVTIVSVVIFLLVAQAAKEKVTTIDWEAIPVIDADQALERELLIDARYAEGEVIARALVQWSFETWTEITAFTKPDSRRERGRGIVVYINEDDDSFLFRKEDGEFVELRFDQVLLT